MQTVKQQPLSLVQSGKTSNAASVLSKQEDRTRKYNDLQENYKQIALSQQKI